MNAPNRLPIVWCLFCLALAGCSGQFAAGDESSRKFGVSLTWSTEMEGKNAPCEVYALAFSPDGKQLVVGSENPYAALLDPKTGTAEGTIGTLTRGDLAIAFSPDGKRLALASNEVQIWQLTDEKLAKTLKVGAASIAFSPDGTKLAVSGGSASIHEISTGKVLATFSAWDGTDVMDTALYSPMSNSVSFSADGKTLAASTDFFDDELPSVNRMQLWDLPSGRLQAFFPGGPGKFFPGGGSVAYDSDWLGRFRNGEIHIIDTTNYR